MKPLFNIFFENKYAANLVLILAPLLVYYQSLWFDFSTLDEQWLILKSEEFLSRLDSFLKVFIQPTSEVYYRPFHHASFIWDYQIGKLDPYYYHFTNVLLHIINVLFIFKLIQQYSIPRQLAFYLTLLFAIHPVFLGSVAWIPGRNDEILSLFFICGLYTQNLYFRSGKIRHQLFCYLSFVGALLSKESAIFFPFIYLANGYVLTGKYKMPLLRFCIPMLLIIGSWFALRMMIVPDIPMQYSKPGDHILNFFKVIFIYIGKSIIPFEQSVFPTIANSSVLPGIITALVLIILFFYVKPDNKRVALFGLFIFIGVLIVPVWFMSNSQIREQYENRAYISMIGMILFISQLKPLLSGTTGKIVFAGMSLVYLSLTFVRMKYYSTQREFVAQAVEQNPDNFFFHQRMAEYLAKDNDFEGAVKHYSEAIRIQPSRGMFYNNRANMYMRLRKKEEALRDFDSAIVKSGHDPRVYLNRCITLSEFNEWNATMSELTRLKQCCQEIIPPEIEKRLMMGWTMNGLKEIDALLIKQPDNAILYANRAKLNYGIGRMNEARADKQKALSLGSKNEQLRKLMETITP